MLTGYENLDQKIEIFSQGQLSLLAGLPGAGKSALAINIMHNLLEVENETRILYITPGMPAQRLAERFIFLDSGISPYNLNFLNLDEKEIQEAISGSAGKFQHFIDEKKLKIIDDNLLTIADISSLCLDHFTDFDLIFVDYLQALKSSHGKEYASRSLIEIQLRELKKIARKSEAAVVLISQLKNYAGQPTAADLLPFSRLLRNETDKIILLHRIDNPAGERDWENEFNVNFNKIPEPVELIVEKNISGCIGSFDFFWEPATLAFRERTPEIEQYIRRLLREI